MFQASVHVTLVAIVLLQYMPLLVFELLIHCKQHFLIKQNKSY